MDKNPRSNSQTRTYAVPITYGEINIDDRLLVKQGWITVNADGRFEAIEAARLIDGFGTHFTLRGDKIREILGKLLNIKVLL